MRLLSFAALLTSVLAFSGCAHKFDVIPIAEGSSVPYTSLGVLEVHAPAGESNAEQYKQVLNAELAKTASKIHNADAVIKVTYWPDPSAAEFPDGLVHARGEMIKFQKFPELTPKENLPAAEPSLPAEAPAPAV